MKFALPNITIYVEAKDETEAKAVRAKIDKLLGDGMTKMVFRGQGINLVGHEVNAEPVKA